MENHVTLVVICALAFNALLVGSVMLLVRMIKMNQRKRQERMVENAKLNSELQQINKVQERLLDSYRDIIEKI